MTQSSLYRSVKGLNYFLKNAFAVKPRSAADQPKPVKLDTPWYI